jgi:Macrocin-O-methyltransferase (TylF)
MTELWREKKNDKISDYQDKLAEVWEKSEDSTRIKLTEFPKYVPKNSLMQFISRYELYKLIKDIPGDIVELGVCGGKGLFSFAQAVFINEPQYHWRNVVGFDTFSGFPDVGEEDNLDSNSHVKTVGAFNCDNYDELNTLKEIHQDFRFMNSRDQIELVKGDVMETIPKYIEDNKGWIISMLYCDLDLYKPTKLALELLWDRIPKGGIVVFDEAIMKDWEGEAIALHEVLSIGKCSLHKIDHLKQFYIVKE